MLKLLFLLTHLLIYFRLLLWWRYRTNYDEWYGLLWLRE